MYCLPERIYFSLLDVEYWQIVLVCSWIEVLWEYVRLTESQLHLPGPLFSGKPNVCLLSTTILSKYTLSLFLAYLKLIFCFFSQPLVLYMCSSGITISLKRKLFAECRAHLFLVPFSRFSNPQVLAAFVAPFQVPQTQ